MSGKIRLPVRPRQVHDDALMLLPGVQRLRSEAARRGGQDAFRRVTTIRPRGGLL
jgi:hypothetical protein